eukprot:COSAG03_NODE_8616_length_787_cov_2.087209_1_plen_81_part_00
MTSTSACQNSTQMQQKRGARIEPERVHVERPQDVDDDERGVHHEARARPFSPRPFLHTPTNTTRNRERDSNSYYATQQPD